MTVYSNVEYRILNISLKDSLVCYGQSELFISEVNFSPAEPKVDNLFHSKRIMLI